MKIAVLISLFIVSFVVSNFAMACASCGSGSSSALTLYPNEKQKFLLGYSRRQYIAEFNVEGESRNTSVAARDEFFFAAGIRPLDRLQLSAQMPYVTNRTEEGKQFSANGDPLVGLKFDLIQQNFMSPQIPQLQLLVSQSIAMAPSVYDYERYDGLDITGSGYESTTVGLDAWWGMYKVLFGAVASYSYNQEIDTDFAQVQKGATTAVTLTSGLYINEKNLVTLGLAFNQKEDDLRDNVAVANSYSRRNDMFLALRYKPKPLLEWRLALRQNASVLASNPNSTESNTASVSYAQVF